MAFDMAGSSGTEAKRSAMPDQKLSDHQLIEATKAGDEAAFGEIMNLSVSYTHLDVYKRQPFNFALSYR